SDAAAVQGRPHDQDHADGDDQQGLGTHRGIEGRTPPVADRHVGADIAPCAAWSNRRRRGGGAGYCSGVERPESRFHSVPRPLTMAPPTVRGPCRRTLAIHLTVVTGRADTFGRITGLFKVPLTRAGIGGRAGSLEVGKGSEANTSMFCTPRAVSRMRALRS